MGHVRVTYPTLTRNQVIERLRQGRASLKKRLPISKMVLYGSYAQDRHTAGSDIDVVIVYEGKERGDAYKLVVEEMNLPRLEPKIFTEEQFNTVIAQSPKFAETLRKDGAVIS